MQAGQRKVATDGYEIMLFPFEIMWMTQGEHNGYCMDFQGAGLNSQGNVVRVLKCPYYAPCSCRCVAKGRNGDWVAFTSNDKVHCADGVLRKVTWQQGHDDTPCNVGDRFTQGDLIGHTGTTGQVTGDHLHFNTASGNYAGWSNHQLKNSIHIYDCCYVDNTVLYRPRTYNWVTYGDSPTPPPPPPPPPGIPGYKKHFPWYTITSKKLHRM